MGPDANFLAQTGALANLFFVVALATGILLLFWYRPSLHGAHASVLAMEADPLLSGFLRTLHRYSSDACMVFVLVHALEALLAGRFDRPRLLAWATGLLLVGVLWLEGWLGYWLVWDEPARLVAIHSARALDVLPVFADPISRSFLVPEALNSLFFFVIFFLHMLIPLAFGIGLWLHIAKLNRAAFLPGRSLTLAALAAVCALSLALPARAGEAADLLQMAPELSLDLFYLLPLRVQGTVPWWAWLLVAGAVVVVAALPLLNRRRPAAVPGEMGSLPRAKPRVLPERCTGCTLCYEDCPYNAIGMAKDARGNLKAFIREADCLNCGVCVGSCNSKGIAFPDFSPDLVQRRLRTWLAAGRPLPLAFVCDKAWGGRIDADAGSGAWTQLPGYRVIAVPCTGWLNPRLVELAAKLGAPGVLVAGCGSLSPSYRLGARWTAERIAGTREPPLRSEALRGVAVQHVRFSPLEMDRLRRQAEAFRGGLQGVSGAAGGRTPTGEIRTGGKHAGAGLEAGAAMPRAGAGAVPGSSRVRRALEASLAALLLAGLLAAAVRMGTAEKFRAGNPGATELVISFKHGGQPVEASPAIGGGTRGEEDLLPHMRGAPVAKNRGRSPVRLEVRIDGSPVLSRSYSARGLFRDGESVGLETLPLEPGKHRVTVRLADGPAGAGWRHAETRTFEFAAGRRRVVLFETEGGFRWY